MNSIPPAGPVSSGQTKHYTSDTFWIAVMIHLFGSGLLAFLASYFAAESFHRSVHEELVMIELVAWVWDPLTLLELRFHGAGSFDLAIGISIGWSLVFGAACMYFFPRIEGSSNKPNRDHE